MNKKIPFDYRTIQKIKTEEYRHFFRNLPQYRPHINHLGEIRWMREAEAGEQHEFFLYSPGFFQRWKERKFPRSPIHLHKLKPAERALRVQIRKHLEEKYLGEVSEQTRQWLTEAPEYEISRKDLEHIPITLEIFKSTAANQIPVILALLLIAVILGGPAFLYFNDTPQYGKLFVETNVEGARVFINDRNFLGYSGRVLKNVPVGEHTLFIEKPGYESFPKSLDVFLKPDSLVSFHFKLERTQSTSRGFLKVSGSMGESKIFVNNDYYGKIKNNESISLPEGSYTVSLRKEGFVTLPSEKVVTISALDTTLFLAEQIPLNDPSPKSRSASAVMAGGTIEVSSNVPGAFIYIDGENTGKETDYVFLNIPYGKHSVKVVKNGYISDPPEQTITLNRTNPVAELSFKLQKEFEQVEIITNPATGEIFVDGELKGKGAFEGLLRTGEHTVSFGDLPGMKSPSSQKIVVKPRQPISLKVDYFPQMNIVAQVSDNGNLHIKNCELYTGHTFSNRGFTSSVEAGPEVVYNEKLNNYFWKIGFAYPYKNPKGSDAIKLTFQLPQELDYNQKFTLKLDAAASKEKYPLTLSSKVDIFIKFNGTILSYYYQPKFLEDINGMDSAEWDITSSIKPGMNSLIIYPTDKNNVFYYIKKIEISN